MRRLLVFVLLALVLPAAASAAPRVSAFYYPWYGMPSPDGAYQHWNQDGHAPPNNIASAYYPLRGLYSSSNALVVSAQMDEIRSAGIDQIDISWWGQGSAEDQRMPLVIADAQTDGIGVAAHLEPYAGRTVASTVSDIQYLENLYGIRTFYIYRAPDFSASDWASVQPLIHAGGGVTVFAQTGMVGWAAAAGFDGVYTYDIVTFGGNMLWHEGTQIEPAAPSQRRGKVRYLSYDGAWGLHGPQAEFSYLARTRYWSDIYKSTVAAQPSTSAP
jgi:hypothetical protein